MPQKRLPDRPDLEHLQNEARALQQELRVVDPAAKLSTAQRELARQYGFASWPRLKKYLETVELHTRRPHEVGPLADPADEFLRLACLTYGNDDRCRIAEARRRLADDPSLATANVFTMAAVGAAPELRDALAADPGAATRAGGPYNVVPLLYLAYSRVVGDRPGWSAVDAAEALLEAGADPNAGFLWAGLPSPFTALTGAFGEGEDGPNQPPHPEWRALARALLTWGADPNDSQVLYNRHFNPGTEHLELLFEFGLGTGKGGVWHRLLLEQHPRPDQNLEDQLTWAANRGYADRVALLLRHGVDPMGTGTNHPILGGRNAMELAVAGGYPDVVALLEAAGVKRPDLDPVDAFLFAVISGTAQGFDPQLASDAIARRPHAVAEAASSRRHEAVEALIKLGWDVNHKQRATALHEAAWNDDAALATRLLELGADPTITDDSFQATPEGWADHAGHDALAALLRGAG